jgi:Na+-transporting NADH:ubiquinone oxidoreductase subunit C
MGKINVNSNAYIITYSVVMVVIVAILLAVTSLSLQPRQQDNILNEKKTQIVKALGENPESVKYEDVIASASIINAEGKVISTEEKAVFEALGKLKDSFAAGEFPLFEAKNGCVVIPMTGNGLWGPIWGYVALEQDKNTVKGVVMDHQGETPGLGAEIAGDAHQAQYVGKQIFVDGNLTGIIVKKGGATPGSLNEVDAITGGTKTCDGVTAMFQNSLANYVGYLQAAAPININQPVELIPVDEEVKVEIVEVSNDKIEQSNE